MKICSMFIYQFLHINLGRIEPLRFKRLKVRNYKGESIHVYNLVCVRVCVGITNGWIHTVTFFVCFFFLNQTGYLKIVFIASNFKTNINHELYGRGGFLCYSTVVIVSPETVNLLFIGIVPSSHSNLLFKPLLRFIEQSLRSALLLSQCSILVLLFFSHSIDAVHGIILLFYDPVSAML